MFKNQSGFTPIQIIFSVLAGALIIGGIAGGALYFSKPSNRQIQQGKCGDGICQDVEKNTGLCSEDCGAVQNGKNTQSGKSEQQQQQQQSQTNQQPISQPVTQTDGFKIGFMSIASMKDLGYVDDLGALTSRSEFWFTDNEFQDMQAKTFQSLIDKNFTIIANPRLQPEWTVLSDYADFKKKLKILVKTKKESIKYWQIGNEPDLAFVYNGKNGYSADDYIDLFIAGMEAVREECSECKVTLAGISGLYDSSTQNYAFYKEILAGIKKKSTYQKPIDVFDFHLYTMNNAGSAGSVKSAQLMSGYKNLLKETGYDYEIEFIITELGTYSDQPKSNKNNTGFSFQTETYQAESLIKLNTVFFNAGVTKVLWIWTTNVYQYGYRKEIDSFFGRMGLIYDGRGSYDVENGIKADTKKESYYAYKTLAAKIKGKNTAQKIADGVYKFSGNGGIVYIAWSDGAQIALPASIGGSVKVTDHLGKESVKDASSIILSSSPIFIEINK